MSPHCVTKHHLAMSDTLLNNQSYVQPTLLSRINERQTLRAIQAHGPMSRAEVARYAGISAPTASKAIESLLRSGWLEEGEIGELVRGRPARKLRLPVTTTQVLGAVIDADVCCICSAGLDGILHENSTSIFPTPSSYSELIETFAQHAKKMLHHPNVQTFGMGVSIPGLIDYSQQVGILSPNVPITNGHAPAKDLAAELGVECTLLQESHALCLAERYYGAARGMDDFAMLDATKGVGLGVMSGGQLLTGHRGLAGELGHITIAIDGKPCGCGNRGCLETLASDSAFLNSLRHNNERLSLSNIQTQYPTMDSLPEEPIHTFVESLAIGVAAVINLFNPSHLFLHNQTLTAYPPLFDLVLGASAKRSLTPSFADCRVVLAKGSKRQGAVAGIIEHLLDALVPTPMRDTHHLASKHRRHSRTEKNQP